MQIAMCEKSGSCRLHPFCLGLKLEARLLFPSRATDCSRRGPTSWNTRPDLYTMQNSKVVKMIRRVEFISKVKINKFVRFVEIVKMKGMAHSPSHHVQALDSLAAALRPHGMARAFKPSQQCEVRVLCHQ